MTQKFQRGFRVEILSRRIKYPHCWENNSVGFEAIIDYSNIENPSEDHVGNKAPFYSLLIIYADGYTCQTGGWFEEEFLELVCSNAKKGIKLLNEFRKNGRLG